MTWDFGDSTTSNSNSPVHSYAAAGSYTVKLVVTSDGCTDSSTKIINVYPTPTGSLSSAFNYIYEGFPTTITATGGNTYAWFLDGNQIACATTNTLNATIAGVYTTRIISSNGCTNFADNSITLSMVKKPVVDFSFDKYCVGLPVNFINSSSVVNSLPVDYLWDFGGGNTAKSVNSSFVFRNAGNATIQLTVTPLNCISLATTTQKTIAIEAPRPGVDYYPVNAVENKPVQLAARDFGTDYLWRPATWLTNPGSKTVTYTGTQEQLYTIRIMAPSGCTTIATQLVRIFKDRDVFVPKAFTPNGDGRNGLDASQLTLGDEFRSGGFVAGSGSEVIPSKKLNAFNVHAGILYSYEDDYKTWYAGGSVYHLTSPKNYFLESNTVLKTIPKRWNLNAGLNLTSFNLRYAASLLVMRQAKVNEILIGRVVGLPFYMENGVLYLGSWYRYKASVIPTINLQWKKVNVGMSYDIFSGNKTITRPKTMELSFAIRAH